MRITALSATALALAGALAAATPSFARDDPAYGYADPCAVQQHESGAAGAVLGGLAGALLGSSLAGRHAQGGGAVIGAVAGAVIGHDIARSDARASDVCRARDDGYVAERAPAPYGRYVPYGGDYYRSSYRPYGYAAYAPDGD